MSDNPIYTYDQLGRLTQAVWPNGSMATFNYDKMGNRTTVVEVAGLLPTPTIPTVAALPKRSQSDFKNNPMVVLLSTGELVSWGDNATGANANGTIAATDSLAQRVVFDPNTTIPPASANIVDWALTNANLYVVYDNGWAYSAGDNAYGQLGHGDAVSRGFLKRIESFVTAGVSVTKVWAQGGYTTTNGGGSAFFLTNDFRLWGVGLNTAGQLGTGGVANVSTPVDVSNVSGHVLDQSAASHVIDVKMATVSTFISTYLLFNSGKVMVAGYNVQGQLGVGTTTNVTTGFTSALNSSSVAITNAASISANGGSTAAGNALIVDTSGNVWTTGYNLHGELGQGTTTNLNKFTQVSALSGIASAKIFGGLTGSAYALTTAGVLWTWGSTNLNQIFKNLTSTTAQSTPAAAAFVPSGVIAQVFHSRGQQGLATTSQLILLMTDGRLVYAGADVGQLPIDNTVTPGAYSLIAMPAFILNGSDTIADIFVHGTGLLQRWFILTGSGRLFASGNNADAICAGGAATAVAVVSSVWQEITFQP
ncbi:MAG: hypothetical protein JSS83_19290 [Cyanobacteria bacterium SZAS LIN-3]|nr:hypothetical protein [Cyanobacteria bacterium SZAS LIN-3]